MALDNSGASSKKAKTEQKSEKKTAQKSKRSEEDNYEDEFEEIDEDLPENDDNELNLSNNLGPGNKIGESHGITVS